MVKQRKAPRDIEPATLFREHEIDLDGDYANNRTLLQNAIMEQEEELFQAILNITDKESTKRPDLNAIDRSGKEWTALHYAVFESTTAGPAYVQKLLSAKDGKVPLHLAVEMGHMGVIELLVKSGANVNATYRSGGILHIALIADKVEAFTWLLKQPGIDLALTDDDHNTIFHIAVRYNCVSEMEQLLMKLSALDDPITAKRILNHRNAVGNTVLHETLLMKNATMEAIVRKQQLIDLTLTNAKGQTADDIKMQQDMQAAQQEQQELTRRETEKNRLADKITLGAKEERIKREVEQTKTLFIFRPCGLVFLVLLILVIVLYIFFAIYNFRSRRGHP